MSIARSGGRYRHYKTQGTYRVLCLATIEADLSPAVVYQSEHDGQVWVRPLANFEARVTTDAGVVVDRFAEIEGEDLDHA